MKIIHSDARITVSEGSEALQVLRHSAAHILAQAVRRLYPTAQLAFGPATENGFYYDVDFGGAAFSENDLPGLEAEMRAIALENLPIKPFTLSVPEACRLMEQRREPYKLEHIRSLPPETPIHFYWQGDHIDMCTGPHITYTKGLKAFRLTGVSGAYWKNDSANRMLTRIYGTAFFTDAELEEHLRLQEEAARRDHRKLGRELQLFTFCSEGAGFPFFLPKGMVLRNLLVDYWRTLHLRSGYQEVSTPILLHNSLWHTSGHWAHYRDIMYTTAIDGEDYCIKPMSCPGGVLIYRSRPHSYREFPLRLAELGLVHRNELSGTLHGLFRVRCFTQDDAHIFMRRDQITGEIAAVIRLIDAIYSRFGFPYRMELSTRPENSMGSDEDWQVATDGLRNALETLGLPYAVNEGDGAFYGPKIDFHLRDSLGRSWQCGTIQLDLQMPQNFDLTYVDERGLPQRPVMLHRTCFGSLERFIGILTEHCAGKFPLWLAPVQVRVLTVSQKSAACAKEVHQRLLAAGLRSEQGPCGEKIGALIRQAQYAERIPYVLIVGEKEAAEGTVSVRSRDTGATQEMTADAFLAMAQAECASGNGF